MRNALLALALVPAACSGRVSNPGLVPADELPAPIALLGKYGAAHACPVDGRVVTAGHVAYRATMTPQGFVPVPMAYLAEDRHGRMGKAVPVDFNHYVDLAFLKLSFAVEYYERGERPHTGDLVTWVEYDFRTAENAYRWRLREARVGVVKVGHFVVNPPPVPGASGSCVFDRDGAVVGIISYGHRTEDERVAGVAVGLETLPSQ